jgi:predicted ATPase/DNA-binding SARP family transcriptional activator
MALDFRILGPLEVVSDGRLLGLGGTRRQAVLARLLLSRNERVSADSLIEEIWGGSAPAAAAKSLQMHVVRLRQALAVPGGEPGDAIVQTLPGGYRIQAPRGTLDRDRFEDGLAEGRRLLAGGRAPEAAERLRAALGQWRGPALGNLADESFARLEATRLDALRVEAMEERIEADLTAGRHGSMVAELEALVQVESFRERLWGQLMLALYRSGRQADALAAFQRVRRHLVDELGIEPGPELTRLHQAILSQDETLAVPPPQEEVPPPAIAEPGTTARPVVAVGTTMTAAPSSPGRNLPAPGSSFVGRAREVPAVIAALESARVVTLAGSGGVGKTRLALEVAERPVNRFPDGAWMVELGSVSESSAVDEAVASALGLAVAADGDVGEAIARRLDDRQMLLVLDNCEHVLDACAELAARLARGRSRSRLLCTSRAPLAVAGERVLRVAPLPIPPPTEPGRPGSAGGPEIRTVDSVRLFVERAREARPDLAVTDDHLGAIAQLCRVLDGVPLAIELAASRVRAMSPNDVLARLESRLALEAGERNRTARHRNLRATIQWSYDLLGANEQRGFRWVSLFPDSFTLSAAESVLGTPDVVETIVALVDNSVLSVLEQGGRTRYRMLETVREFGLARLTLDEDRAAAVGAYLEWAVTCVETAVRDAEVQPRTEVLPPLEAEYRNLVGALELELDVDKRLRLASGLAVLLTTSASLREIRRILQDTLLASDEVRTPEAMQARRMLGRALLRLGQLDEARACLAAAAGDAGAMPQLAAAIAADRALAEVKGGQQQAAEQFILEADRLGAARYGSVWTYRLLVEAQLHYDLRGDLGRARELYETSIAMLREHGPPATLALALAAMAELAVELEDPAGAQEAAREVLAITDPVADAYPRAGALLALGRSAVRAGHAAEAVTWLATGARADIDLGAMETSEILDSLAWALAERGGAREAALLLGAASAQRGRLGLEPTGRELVYVEAARAAVSTTLAAPDVADAIADGTRLTDQALRTLIDEGIKSGTTEVTAAAHERAPADPRRAGEPAPPVV